MCRDSGTPRRPEPGWESPEGVRAGSGRVHLGMASAHTPHLPTSPVPLLCVSSGSRPPALATLIYDPPWSYKPSSPWPRRSLQSSHVPRAQSFRGPGAMGSHCTFLPCPAQGLQAARPSRPSASSVSSSRGAKEDRASLSPGPCPRAGPIPHSQNPVGLACPLPTRVAGPLCGLV